MQRTQQTQPVVLKQRAAVEQMALHMHTCSAQPAHVMHEEDADAEGTNPLRERALVSDEKWLEGSKAKVMKAWP